MACNAIYSVCRSARLAFQHPQSPFHIQRWGNKTLPLLRFSESCPVYFDRHTLQLASRQISMFTLDGRLRFQIDLTQQQETAFHSMRLLEISLTQTPHSTYELVFILKDPETPQTENPSSLSDDSMRWPEYLMIEETV